MKRFLAALYLTLALCLIYLIVRFFFGPWIGLLAVVLWVMLWPRLSRHA